MASRFVFTRAARQLTSAAAWPAPRFVCQRPVLAKARLFSVSAARECFRDSDVGKGDANWRIVKEKKFTEDHEWIELSADGKTGTTIPP
jgi:glycine cleavage system H protein